MNETIFRILAAIVLFTGAGISIYFRIKADRASGERLSRSADGTPMMLVIRIGGLMLWLSPIVYLLNPQWMAWSKIGLPEWVRWFGFGFGVIMVGLTFRFTSACSFGHLHQNSWHGRPSPFPFGCAGQG